MFTVPSDEETSNKLLYVISMMERQHLLETKVNNLERNLSDMKKELRMMGIAEEEIEGGEKREEENH